MGLTLISKPVLVSVSLRLLHARSQTFTVVLPTSPNTKYTQLSMQYTQLSMLPKEGRLIQVCLHRLQYPSALFNLHSKRKACAVVHRVLLASKSLRIFFLFHVIVDIHISN